MYTILVIIVIIIIDILGCYLVSRKSIYQKIEKNYLKENREKLDKQLQTEKQFVEDELLLVSKRLDEETQRLNEIRKQNISDIDWLHKRKEELTNDIQSSLRDQTIILEREKEQQLRAINELINERRERVDIEVDAYRTSEMQKARTAIKTEANQQQKWADAILAGYWEHLAQTTQEKEQELTQVLTELDEYRKKQQAVNEAILRQRAIDEQQDFYRVCLSQETIEDVQILQNVRQKLHFSESLNKLIYDVYVSKSVQEMVKRILQGGAPSGIYKITRIKTGEVYIGKSTNIKDRWVQHCKTVYGAGTIAHSILHTTMAKDGLEQFTFELVEEVPKEKLTEREKYWIMFYGSKEYGLNERNG